MMISMEHIYKSYHGMPVLRDFSLCIDYGRRDRDILLTGPSGIGKTTVLRLLSGLEKPDSGAIQILGGEAAQGGKRLRVGMVFQENRLCEDFSALENVRMTAPSVALQRAEEALLCLLPEEAIRKPVRELSGGMQRRVAIVRAMLPPSDLLLMDEPFTGLDAESRAAAIRYIFTEKNGRALLLVSHETEGLPESLRRIELRE